MAIEKNGAAAWPEAWQEIGAVPHQLIITMPEYTWVALAQLVTLFVAVTALVIYAVRKRTGFGWGTVVGLIISTIASIPLFLTIHFGPERFENTARIERPEAYPISESEKAWVCGDSTGKVIKYFEDYCERRRAWTVQHGQSENI